MPTDPTPAWVLDERAAVGRRLRAARQARGLSVDQLAGAAFVDRKTVMRTEAALHSVSIDNLQLMAAALGVPVWHLLYDRLAPPE